MDSIRECSVDGCSREAYRKRSGMCSMHAARERRGVAPRSKDPAVEWLPIEGHPGYEVSADGRVWSSHGLGRELRQFKNPVNGYWTTGVRDSTGTRVTKAIHVLVCAAFAGPKPSPKHEVRHLDDNPDNNTATNLAWGTSADNKLDMVRNGGHFSANRGVTHCKRGHEFTPQNTYLNPRGSRVCRACRVDVSVNQPQLVTHEPAQASSGWDSSSEPF